MNAFASKSHTHEYQSKIEYETYYLSTASDTEYKISSMSIGDVKAIDIILQGAGTRKIIFPSNGTYRIFGSMSGCINGSEVSVHRDFTGGTVVDNHHGNSSINTIYISGMLYRIS